METNNDLVFRLRKRAEIRRNIPHRKSVQNNEPDRIADLLEEAADRIAELETSLKDMDAKLSDAVLRYWKGDSRIAELEESHPVKQLSDEDIKPLIKKYGIMDAYEYGDGVSLENVLAFANAIREIKE